MRLVQSIRRDKLLRDGSCKVYQIRSAESNRSNVDMLSIVAVLSWVVFVDICSGSGRDDLDWLVV